MGASVWGIVWGHSMGAYYRGIVGILMKLAKGASMGALYEGRYAGLAGRPYTGIRSRPVPSRPSGQPMWNHFILWKQYLAFVLFVLVLILLFFYCKQITYQWVALATCQRMNKVDLTLLRNHRVWKICIQPFRATLLVRINKKEMATS